MPQVLPSILSADFARLADELERCRVCGATAVHIDVMDAHFVPNLTLGPPVIASLRKATKLQLDVHLMMSDPMRYAEDFRKAGSDAITIHVDALRASVSCCSIGISLSARMMTPSPVSCATRASGPDKSK